MPNPFSIGTEIAGLGLEIYGGLQAMGYAKQEAGIEKGMVGVEEQQDATRQSAMHLSAQREMLQQVRTNQMARAQALAGATNQGAQFGSGLQGAYGSISGQTGVNIQGISQSLQFGDKMFELNRQLDQFKIQKADVQGQMSQAQGLMSIGGGIMGLGKALG